jgi:hypothetical protein
MVPPACSIFSLAEAEKPCALTVKRTVEFALAQDFDGHENRP